MVRQGHRHTLAEFLELDLCVDGEEQPSVAVVLKPVTKECPKAGQEIGMTDDVHRVAMTVRRFRWSHSDCAATLRLARQVRRLPRLQRLFDDADTGCFGRGCEDQSAQLEQVATDVSRIRRVRRSHLVVGDRRQLLVHPITVLRLVPPAADSGRDGPGWSMRSHSSVIRVRSPHVSST